MTLVVVQIVVFVILGLGVMLSVGSLWKPVCTRVEGRDILQVIPDWKFFAPSPNRSDYHLLVRHRFGGLTTTPWSVVYNSRRVTLRPRICDAGRRIRKAMVDVSASYITLNDKRLQNAEELRPTISTTMIYLLLLNVVAVVKPWITECQFALIATRDYKDDVGEVIVLSDFHPV